MGKIIALDLPMHEYDGVQLHGRFSASAARIITEALDAHGLDAVCRFGRGTTGTALRQVLGEKEVQVMDTQGLKDSSPLRGAACVLGTSPAHYAVILDAIGQSFPEAAVVTLFARRSLPVRLVMETQPRSGTGYVCANLIRCAGLGYASVFREEGLVPFGDDLVHYQPGHQSYVVKAHFTRTLHYPAYRYSKTAFMFAYMFDSYYSWGKLIRKNTDGSYTLRADSPEWSELQGYIPEHVRWMDYIGDRFHIRYEDFYNHFETTVANLSEYAGLDLAGFEPPRPNPGRMYWSDAYRHRLDQEVFRTLKEAFAPALRRFFPEKNPEWT